MERIKFIRKVDFNKEERFFDSLSNISQFYEDKYLSINPSLHKEDVPAKAEAVKEVIKYLVSKNNLKPTRIIDIGSGSTLILHNILMFINSLGFKNPIGLAVDVSASILKASPSYENIYKLRADALHLPLQNHSFDILLMIDLLEHTQHPREVLTEALRVASCAIIKTPLELSLYTLFRGGRLRLHDLEKRYGHIQHFNYQKIKHLISDNRILWESYLKIPNRSRFLDLFQTILLKFKFYGIFRVLFGGFIVIAVTKNSQ